MSKISIKDESRSTEFEKLSEVIAALTNEDNDAATTPLSEYISTIMKEKIQTIREDAKGKHYAEHDEKEEDEDETEQDVPVKLKTRATKKPPLKKMKRDVEESVQLEDSTLLEFDDSVIKLKNNDVFFEGKLIGTYENDLDDADAGIKFESIDGKVAEEFDNIKTLYSFLMGKFGKNTGLE